MSAFGQLPPPEDPWEHPGFKAFAKRVETELVPKLEGTDSVFAMIGKDVDVKQAVEIGYTLLMGKPLILCVSPGSDVPAGLTRAADEIVEVDTSDPGSAAPRLKAAMERVARRRGEWDEGKGEDDNMDVTDWSG